MGLIDQETKKYVKRPEVFADLFNFLIYDGQRIIHPDSLSEADTTEHFIPLDHKGKAYPVQKYRDVLKHAVIMTNEKAAYTLILGVENQTDTHYAMPVRNMGYDAYNYAGQVAALVQRNRKDKGSKSDVDFLSGLKKDDRILPVITLVLHFGQEPWDGPMRLHELFETQDPKILKFVPDYQINLISPILMEPSEIEKFTSDFKELASFIRCGKNKNSLQNLIEHDERFRHMDPLTANIANELTHSGLNISANQKGEVDMCVAIAGMREESRLKGRLEGRLEGIKEGEARGEARGIAIGRQEGQRDLLAQLISKGILTPDQAAEF